LNDEECAMNGQIGIMIGSVVAGAGTAVAQSQQAQQATAGQIENFKKAFSVCLEAKKYMVKY
jgi:uncharacterized protein (DUF3084 family)